MVIIADITMCQGKGCMLRATCYRNRAKADKYQSWATFEEICNERTNYPNYIPIKHKECENIYKQIYKDCEGET